MSPTRHTLERIATALEQFSSDFHTLTADVHRLAAAVAPDPDDLVGSQYVARRLGVSTVWVAEMARKGIIPKSCIVAGTGTGKVWKFDRAKIDRWLDAGRPGAA
ncbi:MAG: helix-turn-helix domain-containing protein [Planctomycetia bacterium]|nr:helix-turn-helix domain-containing protein [Planctomycetia bacterium]